MDSAHLHLMLNHFPIIGTLIGVAILGYGYLSRAESTQRAALGTLVLMALLAVPVFLTGEPAEEAVEGLAGVSEAVIEQHEEAAELAFWAMEALGLLALAALLWKVRRQVLLPLVLLLGLATTGLMAYTGYLGGQIRHSEIRSSAANVHNDAQNGGSAEGEEQDDD